MPSKQWRRVWYFAAVAAATGGLAGCSGSKTSGGTTSGGTTSGGTTSGGTTSGGTTTGGTTSGGTTTGGTTTGGTTTGGTTTGGTTTGGTKCSGASFAAAQSYAIAGAPYSIAVGDFNGDGRPDLAVATDQVTVFLNQGAGAFGPPAAYPSRGTSVAVADFDGDGHLDLALAANPSYTSSTLYLLPNQGNGTFGTASSMTVGLGASALVAGDLDGDGKPDLAVTSTGLTPSGGTIGPGTVGWFLNQGGWSFSAEATQATGNYPKSVALGDFNGDHKPDLAVANWNSGTVSVLLNQGSGSFGTAATYAIGHGPQGVAVGDVNGDGQLDLVVSNGQDSTVGVLLNQGAGVFGAQTTYATSFYPTQIAVGDFDGDGTPDIATVGGGGTTNGSLAVFLNQGNGTFAAAVNFAVGIDPDALALGDFNGDGKLDVAATNNPNLSGYPSSLSVLLNDCTP